jgi:hypothetical protein
MKEKEKAKVYVKEMIASFTLYTVVLMAALHFGKQMAPGTLRTVVMVTPMIGMLAAFWAIVRAFKRMDDYIKRLLLENVAIAAAATIGWTFTYGFLETAGYPKISMFSVWIGFGAVWGGVSCLRNLIDRVQR